MKVLDIDGLNVVLKEMDNKLTEMQKELGSDQSNGRTNSQTE